MVIVMSRDKVKFQTDIEVSSSSSSLAEVGSNGNLKMLEDQS